METVDGDVMFLPLSHSFPQEERERVTVEMTDGRKSMRALLFFVARGQGQHDPSRRGR